MGTDFLMNLLFFLKISLKFLEIPKSMILTTIVKNTLYFISFDKNTIEI
jgi:glycyl-tRNA synthetase beta subunit